MKTLLKIVLVALFSSQLAFAGTQVEKFKPFKLTLPGEVKLELLPVLPGTFTMGSRIYKNEVRVRITKPFYLGKTEVTQATWKAVMRKNPSYFKGNNFPVECVSWDDAMAFCKKLTEREHAAGRLPRNWRYTLPTEAQWEYACRAGTTTRFCSGNSESALSKVAWWSSNSDGKVHSVGTRSPNAWGFYDMHGNVWEWCSDWYAALRGGKDPAGAQSGSGRVIRGGGWVVSHCVVVQRFVASTRRGFVVDVSGFVLP